MKRILLFVCVALLAWACSKNEDNITDDDLGVGPWDDFVEAISDTTGLRLYGIGLAYTKDDTLYCVLGAKYGKIWCGFFSEIQSEDSLQSSFEEEFVYVGTENLIDSLEFEVGYGESYSVVFIADEGDPYLISCYFFNEEEFAIYRHNTYSVDNDYATIFVNGNDVIYNHFCGIVRLWYDGYYVGCSLPRETGDPYSIFDSKGEFVYNIERGLSEGVIPVSLYDYISISGSTVERVRLPAGTIVWSQTLSVGETINGNAPRVTYSKSLEGRYLHIEATAVNYDGSKESKSFKIDIETGEMEE